MIAAHPIPNYQTEDNAIDGMCSGLILAPEHFPLHTSPIIHAQARTCSGRLLSQLWTGPSRHQLRPPTLLTHTTQNHTRHTLTGTPLDSPSRSEQHLA